MNLTQHSIQTTDGISLAAYVGGNPKGAPLVFVHGYPDNHAVWLPIMKRFAGSYRVIAYDVRGAGQSDRPEHVGAYALPQLADDLWSVSTQLLGNTPFHLIGHDWGSIQSWEPACQARFEGKIVSFTSISGPCLDHVGYLLKKPFDKPLPKLKQALSSWYIYSFHVPKLAEFVWRKVAPHWHKLQRLEKNPTQLQDSLYGMNLYRANMFQKQKRPDAKRAICPVHLVILERDEFVTPILFDGLERWVSDLTMSRLPLRHWGVVRSPELLAEVILRYLLASKQM